MTDTKGITGGVLEGLALPRQESTRSNELGQDDFFKLMIEQLKNQDPTKPADSQQFLGQLAQFGTVNGIQQLQTSFESLASRLQSNDALQASTLVGRSVLLESSTGRLEAGGSLAGAVDLEVPAQQLQVRFRNSAGLVVKTLELGDKPTGQVPFTWNGLDDSGAPVAAGIYRMEVEGRVNGTTTALAPMVQARVDSVSIQPGGAGTQLNLAGYGAIDLADVRRVM